MNHRFQQDVPSSDRISKPEKPRETSLSRRDLFRTAAALPLAGSGIVAAPATSGAAGVQTGTGLRIVVVGAGAFGGWTALHLQRQGADVTLLDTWGPGNSRASSGGETRVIRGIYGPDGIYVRLVARAFEIWKREQKRWKRRLYQPTGALWMFSVEDHYARQSMPLLREEGLRVTELNLEHARKRFPQIDFDGVRTIFYEEDAGYLRARRCCEAVWLDFVKNGGDYRQLEVRPARMDKSRLEGVQLSDGTRLEADLYLFAAGPWLGRLFPRLLKDRIHPTRQEVFYFGTPAADLRYSESNLPVWVDFGKSIFYGIPGSDRRGFKIADDTRGEAFDPTHGERVPTTSAIQESRRYLARRFPGLSGAPLLEARVCQYENSPDGHLIFDRHPRAANLWLLGGGSGHGFKLGPALGEYVAERLLGRSEIDPFFSLSRFKDVGGSSTQMQG